MARANQTFSGCPRMSHARRGSKPAKAMSIQTSMDWAVTQTVSTDERDALTRVARYMRREATIAAMDPHLKKLQRMNRANREKYIAKRGLDPSLVKLARLESLMRERGMTFISKTS
jgi:hypothetical protein